MYSVMCADGVGQKIAAAPKPRWRTLSHRRLQTWPSDLVKDSLIEAKLPPWLIEPVITRLLALPVTAADTSTNIFSSSPHKAPNHVLINEYPPGVGIMPHKVISRPSSSVRKAHILSGRCGLPPSSLYHQSRCQSLPRFV
jgi:hypothetical protein